MGIKDDSPNFDNPRIVLNNLFLKINKLLANNDQKAVIVIDGLDEEINNSIHSILLTLVFDNVTFVLSSRQANFLNEFLVDHKSLILDFKEQPAKVLKQDTKAYMISHLDPKGFHRRG